MNKGTKAKWFFIGLISGWILPIIIGLTYYNLVVHDDPFNGVRPDVGKSLHKFGKQAQWHSSKMLLGNSDFIASAGPIRYEGENSKEWDYYAIDVEKYDGEAFYVYFERNLQMSEVPDSLLDMKIQDIAEYNEESRIVTFEIGEKNFKYELPKR